MKPLDKNIALGYIAAFGSAVSYGIVTLVAQKIVSDYFPPVVASTFSIIFGMVILGVLLVLVIGANYYAKLQLKKALSEVSAKNDFSYETLDVNVLLGKVSIDNVSFKSKSFELESPSIKLKLTFIKPLTF